MKWADVKGANIFIKRAINYRKEITKGKNENALRRITLGGHAQKVLAAQRASCDDTEYVFPISSQNHYEERLARYCESNGLSRITPYELRHTFVSVTKSLPEGQIRTIVGHSKNMDTYGIYGHDVEGEAEKTACNINNVFDAIIRPNTAEKI